MKKTTLHAALAAAFLAPGVALAQHFDAVDAVPLANGGRFPAYTIEPVRPTDIYVRGGVARDNNIFRLSSGATVAGVEQRSDTITRAGVGIRHEQRIVGRQSVRLTANLDQYAYDRYSILDHTEYGLRGEWLWEFTNALSGTVGFERHSRLADLAQRQRPVKDMIIDDHAFLAAAYLLGPTVRLRGGLDGAKGSHSDAAFDAATARTTTATGAVEYVTPLGNAAGVEFRRTQGNFPTQEAVGPGALLVDNNFTEKEVAGVLTWVASSQLRAVGRIGRTQRNHVQFPERDFKGTTGRATVDWTPLGKTGFELAIYKEPRSIVDIAASYVVVKGATLGPRWAPTEKLAFSALLVNERQDFKGDPLLVVVPGTPERQETVRGIRVGGSWEPTRFSQVQLGWDHGKRTSTALLRDYDYTSVMLNLRLSF